MEKRRPIDQMLLGSRRGLGLVFALVMMLVAGAVILTALQMRRKIREQIARRDGEVLYAVAQMHFAEDPQGSLEGPTSDPGRQLTVALRCSQLRGVMGVRIFDPEGRFVESFPPSVREENLGRRHLPKLIRLIPASVFHARQPMSNLFYPDSAEPEPGTAALLEVNVPLHVPGGPLAGIAQFLVEGQSIASEYAELDRHLARQGAVVLAASAALMALGLGWAFRRLRQAHRLVAERTTNLLLANQELALAAKTSALGAVTAHLIHGLRNPLAGLRQYVATRGAAVDGSPETDWQQAVDGTRRMQALIDQVVGVLREEQAELRYEVTLSELAQMLRTRIEPAACEKGVRLNFAMHGEAALPNRDANLVLLILVNLAENAVHATRRGGTVTLALRAGETGVVCEVQDQGPGFPPDLPLFRPCVSNKENGTGIGLAVCKQLAGHLGADLELATNSPGGCVFTLRLPSCAAGSPAPANSGRAARLARREEHA